MFSLIFGQECWICYSTPWGALVNYIVGLLIGILWVFLLAFRLAWLTWLRLITAVLRQPLISVNLTFFQHANYRIKIFLDFFKTILNRHLPFPVAERITSLRHMFTQVWWESTAMEIKRHKTVVNPFGEFQCKWSTFFVQNVDKQQESAFKIMYMMYSPFSDNFSFWAKFNLSPPSPW